MIDVMEYLETFSPRQGDGYVDFTVPVLFYSAHTFLDLRIIPGEDTYTVLCPDDLFYEANGPQERYFNIFMSRDEHYHYDMEIRDNIIFRTFENDFNPNVAVDEVIRFFVRFDDYILENDVIGHEEDFE